MSSHDPLGHSSEYEFRDCPECNLIARVRTDERATTNRRPAVATEGRHEPHSDGVAPPRPMATLSTYSEAEVREYLRQQRASDEVDCHWSWISRESELMAHAEAVAARLVEVICRLDFDSRHVRESHGCLVRAAVALEKERDAARAEVAALQVFAQDANEAFASGRRDVLADLRAKVATRYMAESGASAANALDPAAFLIQKNAAVGTLKWVLALIDGAQ